MKRGGGSSGAHKVRREAISTEGRVVWERKRKINR